MKFICYALFSWCALGLCSPVFAATEVKKVTILPAGLNEAQLKAGLQTGLQVALDGAMAELAKTDPAKLSIPPALERLAAGLGKGKQAATVEGFNTAWKSAATQILPQAVDVMKGSLAGVKIEDAMAVVQGGNDAGTKLLRGLAGATLREKLKPFVAKATESAGVNAKAKEMLAAVGPLAALAGKSSVKDLDSFLCDQVIEMGFQQMAKQEAALRADPAGFKNALAAKVFGLAKTTSTPKLPVPVPPVK